MFFPPATDGLVFVSGVLSFSKKDCTTPGHADQCSAFYKLKCVGLEKQKLPQYITMSGHRCKPQPKKSKRKFSINDNLILMKTVHTCKYTHTHIPEVLGGVVCLKRCRRAKQVTQWRAQGSLQQTNKNISHNDYLTSSEALFRALSKRLTLFKLHVLLELPKNNTTICSYGYFSSNRVG